MIWNVQLSRKKTWKTRASHEMIPHTHLKLRGSWLVYVQRVGGISCRLGSSSLSFNPNSRILDSYGRRNAQIYRMSIEIEHHFFKMSHIFQPKLFLRCGYDKDCTGSVFVTLVQVNTFPEFEMREFCSKMARREDGSDCPIFDPKCSKWHVCTCSMEKKIGWSVFYVHARVFVGLGRKGTATVYLIKEL